MAKVWNIRKRHEWLVKSLKGKRLTKRARERIGLEAALERKNAPAEPAEAAKE